MGLISLTTIHHLIHNPFLYLFYPSTPIHKKRQILHKNSLTKLLILSLPHQQISLPHPHKRQRRKMHPTPRHKTRPTNNLILRLIILAMALVLTLRFHKINNEKKKIKKLYSIILQHLSLTS